MEDSLKYIKITYMFLHQVVDLQEKLMVQILTKEKVKPLLNSEYKKLSTSQNIHPR